MDEAIRLTAPGQPIRAALDMIIAGHLGALICVGDVENVLAAGNDGFPLNISFTSNRLFELSKMDGAIVIDGDVTQILRANFHLNPDPSLATSETGMRHRTAARMSVLTDAIVISVSSRRAVVNVYVHGKSYQIQTVPEVMSSVNQLVSTLQTTRTQLDRKLLHLTGLELDDYVTLADITDIHCDHPFTAQIHIIKYSRYHLGTVRRQDPPFQHTVDIQAKRAETIGRQTD